MIEAFRDIGSFLLSLLDLFFKVLSFCIDSFFNGAQFFISTFTNIPLFLLELFEELPSFYQVGITGIFGLLILVVFLKLILLVRS